MKLIYPESFYSPFKGIITNILDIFSPWVIHTVIKKKMWGREWDVGMDAGAHTGMYALKCVWIASGVIFRSIVLIWGFWLAWKSQIRVGFLSTQPQGPSSELLTCAGIASCVSAMHTSQCGFWESLVGPQAGTYQPNISQPQETRFWQSSCFWR